VARTGFGDLLQIGGMFLGAKGIGGGGGVPGTGAGTISGGSGIKFGKF